MNENNRELSLEQLPQTSIVEKVQPRQIPSFEFEFPIGIINKNKEICKKFKIRPMTGRIRKQVGDTKYHNNQLKITEMLIKETLLEVEGVDIISDSMISNMLPGDRDFLLLKLKKISMPKDEENIILSAKCSACKCDMEMEINIDSFKINKMDDKFNSDIMNIKGINHRIFSIESEEYGKLIMRFQTLSDQEIVSPLFRKNPIEAEHLLLSRLIISYNGKPLTPDDFDDLSLPEITWIEDNSISHNFGVDLTKEIECYNCNAKNEMSVDILGFLFQSRRSKIK